MDAKVTERRCGGWLAVSAPDEPIKIGVTAATKEQANVDHAAALCKWRALLSPGDDAIEYHI